MPSTVHRTLTPLARLAAPLARPLRAGAAAITLAGMTMTMTQIVLAPAAVARYGSVHATSAVNVRSGPSTSSSILGVLATGDSVAQTGPVTQGFVQVGYHGTTGYVYASYVSGESADAGGTTTAPAPGTRTHAVYATDAVNVRAGASLDATVVAHLAAGDKVQATGVTSSSWAQVVYGGVLRWVYGSYLSSTAPSTAASSASTTVVGHAVTTTPVMLRSNPGITFTNYGDLPTGTVVDLTGKTANGVSQIVWQGQLRWVNSSFLTAVANAATVTGTPLPAVIGTRYATASLDIRSAASSASANVVDSVPSGTALKITGTVSGGFAQVIYQGAVRWVTARYLSATSPLSTSTGGNTLVASSAGAMAVAFAYAHLGDPYVYGANGPNSWDCSSLTQHAWAAAGVSIPRVSYAQLSQLPSVSVSNLQPGDIIGFYSGGHVGIYVGGGYVIHAPHTGDVVRKVPMSQMPFYKAVRPS